MPSRSGDEGGLELEAFIRNIPDFPVPGIQFKDISPLLAVPQAFRTAVTRMSEPFRGAGVTRVAGIEARGFIFAAGIALDLGAGLVMLRKPGKLPSTTVTMTYALEYGSDAVEVHQDALGPSDRVLIVDDLVATGGTLRAARRLIERLGAGVAGFALLVELEELRGREGLDDLPIHALLRL